MNPREAKKDISVRATNYRTTIFRGACLQIISFVDGKVAMAHRDMLHDFDLEEFTHRDVVLGGYLPVSCD